MKHCIMSAAPAIRRGLPVLAAAMTATVVLTSHSLAQQPAPQPKSPQPKQKQLPKQQPQPPQPPGSGAGPGQGAGAAAPPAVTFSAWTKVCAQGGDANAKRVCFIGKDGRIESGMPVVAAVVIEPDGDPRRILRITLPLGVALPPGTRVIVDQGQPMTAHYVICFANGCMADIEASNDLIATMKKGKGLIVQGINGSGQMISLELPLGDFAKAYDGPASDPKSLEPKPR